MAQDNQTRLSQLHHTQRLASVGQLAGGLAHDFNNTLMVIASLVDLVQMAGTEHERKESLGQIAEAVRSGTGLARRLLDLCRKAPQARTAVNLNRLIEETATFLQRLISPRIRVELELVGGLPELELDPIGFQQVLTNLILNACEAMPAGGSLEISTRGPRSGAAGAPGASGRAPAPEVVLCVADQGAGVPDGDTSRLFEPFYSTKDAGSHCGLGLSIVRDITELHGGRVEVGKRPGGGAEFRMILPVNGARVPAPGGSNDARMASEETRPWRILFVDDDDPLRLLFSRMLRGLGYSVTEAADGQAALELWSASPQGFDVLIIDIVMPGMDGRELAERIQARSPHTPVIFISGHVAGRALEHRREVGARVFLAKPFSKRELLAKLQSVLPSRAH